MSVKLKSGHIVLISICLTAFFFSTMEVSLKLAGQELDAFQITFLRFFGGGLVMLPPAFAEMKRRRLKLTLSDFGYFSLLGFVCVPMSMLAFQFGVIYANASTASVLICINPIFTMLFAILFKQENYTHRKLLTLLIAVSGIIFMVRPWSMQDGNTVFGVGSMLIAALFLGLYSVLGKKHVARIGVLTQNSFSFLIGSMMMLIVMLFMDRPVLVGLADNLLIVAYAAVGVTGLGYYFLFLAIKHSNATTASFAFFMKACIAPFLAMILLNERILYNTYIGIALILTASYLNYEQQKQL